MRAGVGVVFGTNRKVLCPAVDEAIAEGLKTSRCKVILPGTSGEHREVMLPEGQSGFGHDGTSCYMNLEANLPALTTLLRPEEVAGDIVERVNVYLSRARSGTPLHFDARAVWIVQLVGSKLWLVSKTSAVARPHRNCVAPREGDRVDYDGVDLAIPTDLIVCVLRPGDWLHVPRAAWHATFTMQGSISATLAAPAWYGDEETPG